MNVIVREGVAEGMPWVKGVCPACGSSSLFVGSGGWITCSYLPCPDPVAAAKALKVKRRWDGIPAHHPKVGVEARNRRVGC